MKRIRASRIKMSLLAVTVTLSLVQFVSTTRANERPIADPGPTRYVGLESFTLDGSGSYDPDDSGPLGYMWRQVSGPVLTISDPTIAMPEITGPAKIAGRGVIISEAIPQSTEIQYCEFELIVTDRALESLSNTVTVVIVPGLGNSSTLIMENPPFDCNKPTVIFFGGGDCIQGGGSWGRWGGPNWAERANIISFPSYGPDRGSGLRTYYNCGDEVMTYLSDVAPDYSGLIQTMGYSTGGQPAIDVGIRCNVMYADRRYAINRVTFYDATGNCRGVYADSINTFLASSVDGEQCWIDNHVSTLLGVHNPVAYSGFHTNVLNLGYDLSLSSTLSRNVLHGLPIAWYANSLTNRDTNQFNSGIIGGAYWSVIGAGKNLQLASTPNSETYRFKWFGDEQGGTMGFHDELSHPGKLPEPVTLVGPVHIGDPDGVVFTCESSENVVMYELLFGSDPERVMDYRIVSESSTPPLDAINILQIQETWWTIRARDAFGSTIYADSMPINLNDLPAIHVENVSSGKRYARIQHAIDDALPGDEIRIGPGHYRETLHIEGKHITLTSMDPGDPAVVADTVIEAGKNGSVVTSDFGASGVFKGFTLLGNVSYWHDSGTAFFHSVVTGQQIVRSVAENLTTGKQYGQISEAVGEAVSGDEIVVSEGISHGAVDFDGKDLVLRSTDPRDSSVVAATVIHAAGDIAVTIANGESKHCVLAGFTITAAADGVHCENASPSIRHCRVTGNESNGITVRQGGNPQISHCVVSGNKQSGIELWSLRSSRRTEYSFATITNCTIAGNWGTGIADGEPIIRNSIIYENGVQIQGDALVNYCNVQGSLPGNGNIDRTPDFANPGYWDIARMPDGMEESHWIDGDYHLRSRIGRWDATARAWVLDDSTSPCIDAGDPSSPVSDESLPNGAVVNMGAYGGTIEASRSP